MALDPKYILATNLQEFIVDDDTGLPLANGYIKFYADNNHTEPKPVFQLTGYPSYTYSELQNPLPLGMSGTTVDESGNDIRIYYYPYDDNGNVQLYYVEVYDSDDNLKFVRQAWPNFFEVSSSNAGMDAFNYIPNGQFRVHYNVNGDLDANIPFGQIQNPTTILAPGGWTFERSIGSTAIDNVTFFRYGSYVASPSGSPRYGVQIACNGANPSDIFKNLCLKFNDVNKFSSTSQNFTFTLEGYTVNSSDILVTLYLIKNFGTGGSPSSTEITEITTFTISSPKTLFTTSFEFGDNLLKNLGTNNDDYVQLALGFPTNQTYNAIFTDFSLLFGDVVVSGFPYQTDSDMYARSIMGWINTPNANGNDLYLPVVTTPYGATSDQGVVGEITAVGYKDLPISRLRCDGSSYPYDGHSSDGIPYSRLGNKIIDFNGSNIPYFGTGYNFATCLTYADSPTHANELIITNKPGAQTNTVDGAIPTGFTFHPNVCTGASSYGFKGYFCGNSPGPSICVANNDPGIVSDDTDEGTSNLNVSIKIVGQTLVRQLVTINVTAIPAAGTYFNISTPTQQWSPWFTVDGSGTAPSAPGTLIPIALLSTFNTTDVARCIAAALSAFQISPITVLAASSITNGSYFTFNANSQLYAVYYSLNNTAIAPVIPGAILIKVIYTGTETVSQIGDKTNFAINTKYYATPDLRGVSIRGLDNGAGIDPDYATRFARNFVNYGSASTPIGSMQFSEIYQHYHEQVYGPGSPSKSIPTLANHTVGLPDPASSYFIGVTGGSESRPYNMGLNYVIRY